MELLSGMRVVIDVDAPLAVKRHHAQIVDAVHMIGVVMGVEHPVDPAHIGVEQLLPQVRRSVDQDGGDTIRSFALHEQRAAQAPVLRLGGIARAPAIADARRTARGAAAENGDFQAHAALAVDFQRVARHLCHTCRTGERNYR